MATLLNHLIVTLLGFGSFFAVVSAIVWQERVFVRWKSALPGTLTNIGFWFFDGLLIAPVIGMPAILVGQYLPKLHVPAASPTLTILAAIVIGDFAGYWRHRLQHLRWLWPAHAVHHSDRTVTWLTLVRMHPLDRLSTVTLDSLALILLGFPPYAVLANTMARNLYGHFIHADLPADFAWLGRILISPKAHRWHHSSTCAGLNFATIFSIWDQLFGTFHVATDEPTMLGIDRPPGGIFAELLGPFGEWLGPLRHGAPVAAEPRPAFRGITADAKP